MNRLIEALLYVQGEKGISPSDLKVSMKESDEEQLTVPNARKLLKNFMNEFNTQDHGIFVVEYNDVFKFATRQEFESNISKMVITIKKQKLSAAAIETAGIIAYKQPISKSGVNEVRGKSSEAVVNTLLVKGLIEEKGIADTPGRPILYGITNRFYDYFQINSLSELPKLAEFNESEGLDNDFELYSSQRQDQDIE